ncbi:MAG: glycosyltransferase family 39 protein [Candidatus Eiseniibacteriota bacterium]|nr:MAG: glycosyltransferase family 39 protein [Candidatus Eisenbacteria bacterium]
MAGLLTVVGGSTVIARMLQVVLGSLSCALAYGIGAKCYGQRVGIVTGLLCALYWVLAYFDAQFLQPVLLIFLLLVGFLFLFTSAERGDPRRAGLGGLAFGLYSITRPEILLFFPLALWWAYRIARSLPRSVGRWFLILLLLGLAAPPALVALRNSFVGRDWVIIASPGGVNFYIGNNPESNGMQAVVPGTRATWWGGYEDTRAIAERASGRSLKPSEVSDYWFRRGVTFIRERPSEWLVLTLRKAALFIGNVEIPNNEPYEAQRRSYWSLRSIPLGFGVLFALFLVSLPHALTRRSKAPRGGEDDLRRGFMKLILQCVLVYSLVVVAFFVTGRFRVPLVPLIAVGAAATLVRLVDFFRRRRFPVAGAMLAAAVLITGTLNADYFSVRRATRGFVEYTSALDALESGDTDTAISRLEAIRRSGVIRTPEVYLALARAYIARDGPRDRVAVLEVAEDGLRFFPDEAELLWYSCLGHLVAKNLDNSRTRIEHYLTLRPNDVRALRIAFSVAMAQGRLADARAFLSRAEMVDPANPLVGQMRRELGAAGP